MQTETSRKRCLFYWRKFMAVSEAQKRASKKYFDNNYKQVKLSMPIKEAETLDIYCKEHKCSKAGFIRALIREKLEESS